MQLFVPWEEHAIRFGRTYPTLEAKVFFSLRLSRLSHVFLVDVVFIENVNPIRIVVFFGDGRERTSYGT